MDGLASDISYTASTTDVEATVGYALTYTGVEGLSVSYGAGEVGGKTDGSDGADVTTMKASFAFGPVTAAMSIRKKQVIKLLINGGTKVMMRKKIMYCDLKRL